MGIFDKLFGNKKKVEPNAQKIEEKHLNLKDKIDHYYPILNNDNERIRNEAASCLLKHCGIDGARILIKALNNDNENAYFSAAWAFAYDLQNHKNGMDKNELKIVLNEANDIFIKVVQNSKLISGTLYFNKNLIWALNALREIGNPTAIPVLTILQNRVQEKFNKEGMRKEYIQTRDYGGTISSDSNIDEVKYVIESINGRNKEI